MTTIDTDSPTAAPPTHRAHLALRRTAADGAGWLARLACALIRWRLASPWCHGGLVVDGTLLHATATDGLCRVLPGNWQPHKWELISVPDALADAIVQRFCDHYPSAYDWISLLAWVLPGRWRDGKRLYCFEWCLIGLTGNRPPDRVTPSALILLAADLRADAAEAAYRAAAQRDVASSVEA